MPGLTMVEAGRATLAAAVISHNLCLAVGAGSSQWASPPPDPASSDTQPVSPTAMVRASVKNYVTPDNSGAIVMPDGTRWSVSPNPTKYLYVSWVLAFGEGPTDRYRELGVYLDPTFDGTVTAGQNYIPWANVINAGNLLALERFSLIDRTGLRITFSKIMTF